MKKNKQHEPDFIDGVRSGSLDAVRSLGRMAGEFGLLTLAEVLEEIEQGYSDGWNDQKARQEDKGFDTTPDNLVVILPSFRRHQDD